MHDLWYGSTTLPWQVGWLAKSLSNTTSSFTVSPTLVFKAAAKWAVVLCVCSFCAQLLRGLLLSCQEQQRTRKVSWTQPTYSRSQTDRQRSTFMPGTRSRDVIDHRAATTYVTYFPIGWTSDMKKGRFKRGHWISPGRVVERSCSGRVLSTAA